MILTDRTYGKNRVYAPYIGMVYSRNDSLNTQFDRGGYNQNKRAEVAIQTKCLH